MNTTLNSLWTILIATALIGCAEIDSEHLRTSGFHADITVTANDDSTIVSTRLNTSNAIDADHINLTAGDQLTASIPGRSIVLHQWRYFHQIHTDDINLLQTANNRLCLPCT